MRTSHILFAAAAVLLLSAGPVAAQQTASEVEYCRKLDSKAAELMDNWRYRVQEIANDGFEDKQRRLREYYDATRYRLVEIRDDAQRNGCTGLPEAISTALRQWERP